MQRGLRLAFRLTLGLTALLVLAQLWYVVAWAATGGSSCDFPEECLGTAYPNAFRRAEWLWTATNVTGLLTLGLALARRSSVTSVARLGSAWLIAMGAYALSPWARFAVPDLSMGFEQPVEFGGIAWWAAALWFACLLLYGWDVVRRAHEEAAEVEALEQAAVLAARARPSAPR